jgi:hypothetical protein
LWAASGRGTVIVAGRSTRSLGVIGINVPKCPSCNSQFRWRDGSRFWSPWNYPCPYCGVSLEASKYQKGLLLASVPFGVLVAAIAIYFEESGKWQTKDSGLFFAAVLVGLIVFAIVSWPRTRFQIKKGK